MTDGYEEASLSRRCDVAGADGGGVEAPPEAYPRLSSEAAYQRRRGKRLHLNAKALFPSHLLLHVPAQRFLSYIFTLHSDPPPPGGEAPVSSSTPAPKPGSSCPSFVIRKCAQEDIPQFFELVSEAFGHEHPYIDAKFPRHETSEGRAAGTARILSLSKSDRFAHWLKIVNGENGMIAAAIWNVYDGEVDGLPASETAGDYWNSKQEQEYASHLSKAYLVNRKKKGKETGGQLLKLDCLVVHPDFQSQGAGTLLTSWGTELADEMGIDTIIEATAASVDFYKKAGFELLEDFELELPEKWKDQPRQRIRWMVRSPRKEV